jgi:hypothetical protein
MLPEVALSVAVAVPTVAVAVAERVSLLVELVLAGLNAAVTPLGKPVMATLAEPVNPLAGVMVTAPLAEDPCAKLKLEGEIPSEKLDPPVTVNASVMELVVVPEVPVTVIFVVPDGALALAVNVSVLVVVVVAGLNEAATPLGSPSAVRVTWPVKPLFRVSVMVFLAVEPGAMLSAEGEPASVNELAKLRPSINAWPVGVPHPVARS